MTLPPGETNGPDYDLLIVGGGINGAGIARDAAGRGLKVCLVEMNDLASGTSSWSTKLIHGGLRYLEHYEFKLVRESLIEREILLKAAPHLISPLRFVLPHHSGLRPKWLLRLGLFLYDHLGGRRLLPSTTSVDLARGALGSPLQAQYTRGFEYSDCRADDARLVVTNALGAREKGADICTRTRFLGAERTDGGARWTARLSDASGKRTITARAIVNAAGPWVTGLFANISGAQTAKRLRLVKGSHIFVRKLFDHDRAYIFQNKDDRIVFAIPYPGDLTLIGTTEEAFDADPATAEISADETAYLCAAISEYFKQAVRPEDVVSTYSGVRPLFDDMAAKDASKVTRDYAFDVGRDDPEYGSKCAPLLSIYGGKLTTYRKLAEDVLKTLQDDFPQMNAPWTSKTPLPGGAMGYRGWAKYKMDMAQRYAFLDAATLERMVRAYGDRLPDVLGSSENMADLGRTFGAGLTEAELTYMRAHEWATTAEDALWRRSKLHLAMNDAQQDAVQTWFDH